MSQAQWLILFPVNTKTSSISFAHHITYVISPNCGTKSASWLFDLTTLYCHNLIQDFLDIWSFWKPCYVSGNLKHAFIFVKVKNPAGQVIMKNEYMRTTTNICKWQNNQKIFSNLHNSTDLFNLALADLATLLFAMPAGEGQELKSQSFSLIFSQV